MNYVTQGESSSSESLMDSGRGRQVRRNTLTENIDSEIVTLNERLEGLHALKTKLEEVPGVQEILDLLTQHGIR